MKSHVRENIVKNAIMNGIRLIPRSDGNSDVELSGIAWDLISSILDGISISNIIYTSDKKWQADGAYRGHKVTCQDVGLGEVVVALKNELVGIQNE